MTFGTLISRKESLKAIYNGSSMRDIMNVRQLESYKPLSILQWILYIYGYDIARVIRSPIHIVYETVYICRYTLVYLTAKLY